MTFNRHSFLAAMHEVVRPRTYLEIGVDDGLSLTLSRVPSVAIDPAFSITKEIQTDVHLVRSTSDEFFARPDPLARLPRPVIDLAFIDGMHLAEFALRDFMNVERYTTPGSVIVLDDMLPHESHRADRHRHTISWMGDVYKVILALRKHRPDLITLQVNTGGSGLGLILLPDASETELHDRYDDLVAEIVTPDPQVVPEDVLHRRDAVSPDEIVNSPIWDQLRHLRDRHRPTPVGAFRDLYATATWTTRQPAPHHDMTT